MKVALVLVALAWRAYISPPGPLTPGSPLIYAAMVPDGSTEIDVLAVMPKCSCAGRTMALLRSTTSGGPYTQILDTPQLASAPDGSALDTMVPWTDTAISAGTTYYYVVRVGAMQSPEVAMSIPAWWPPDPGTPKVTPQ
ncbi:MAG TPA: hypothetical protein VJQ82_02600 [Terriglobales bacterium]|nr:hypothetical protein [Terriglobales bacterium]